MAKSAIKVLVNVAIVIGFSFCMQNCFAQSPVVKTFIDKSDILIGEQIQYKVTATFPTGVYKVHWFAPPDSLAHFEIVDRNKIDTTSANNTTTLEQTIMLTSFDSGRWNTPAFMINFDPLKDDTTINLFTDSIPVNVGYAPADTTNQLRDIKPIMEVTVKSYLWYYIGGALLVLILAGIFLWRYFRNRKQEPLPLSTSRLSPYDEAIQNLDMLKALDLQKPGDVKQYHAKLAEVLKWYISRKQRVSIMNKTTGDVLVHLAENHLPQEIITKAATALRCGDAVKFAKYLPIVTESEDGLDKIKAVIQFIHSAKPEKS